MCGIHQREKPLLWVMQKDGQEHILVFKKWVGPKQYIKVSSQMILI